MQVLIYIAFIPIIFFIVFLRKRNMETFTNTRIPVSEFTYEYMLQNVNEYEKKKYFTNVSILRDGSRTSAASLKEVRLDQGTRLDVPKTYSSTWAFT